MNSDIHMETLSNKPAEHLGRVNVGWTLGEEIMFETQKKSSHRRETCYSDTESCLLGINKNKLSTMQKELLENANQKDYYIFESVLKGNYLLK